MKCTFFVTRIAYPLRLKNKKNSLVILVGPKLARCSRLRPWIIITARQGSDFAKIWSNVVVSSGKIFETGKITSLSLSTTQT